jgi:hypothetical protein
MQMACWSSSVRPSRLGGGGWGGGGLDLSAWLLLSVRVVDGRPSRTVGWCGVSMVGGG